MNDLIDRQEAQPGQKDFEKQLHDMFDHIWDCEIDHPAFQDTVGELMEAAIQAHNNSAQPEPLTYIEQKIFLAAMGREEKVCKQVDDECREEYGELYKSSLVRICHEIRRKVKSALWT